MNTDQVSPPWSETFFFLSFSFWSELDSSKINPLILVEKSSQLAMRITCFVTRMQKLSLFLSLGSSHGKPLTPIVVSLIFILAFAGWRWRPGIPNWEPVPLGLTWTWFTQGRRSECVCTAFLLRVLPRAGGGLMHWVLGGPEQLALRLGGFV